MSYLLLIYFLRLRPSLCFFLFCEKSYGDKRGALLIAHWEIVCGDKTSLSDEAEEAGEQEPGGESDESAEIYRFLGPKIVHFQNILFRAGPEHEKELELISSWRFCAGEESPHWFVGITDLGRSIWFSNEEKAICWFLRVGGVRRDNHSLQPAVLYSCSETFEGLVSIHLQILSTYKEVKNSVVTCWLKVTQGVCGVKWTKTRISRPESFPLTTC